MHNNETKDFKKSLIIRINQSNSLIKQLKTQRTTFALLQKIENITYYSLHELKLFDSSLLHFYLILGVAILHIN